MIIIAPTDNSEKYFAELAKNAWTNYNLRDPDVEDGLIKAGKTLLISCELNEGDEIVPIKLHYRYLKETIYCFVEEV